MSGLPPLLRNRAAESEAWACPLTADWRVRACLQIRHPAWRAVCDTDSDGHCAPSDCAPTDAATFPGALDECGDAKDSDCSGADGIAEICGDGVDQDCDTVDLVCAQPVEPILPGGV